MLTQMRRRGLIWLLRGALVGLVLFGGQDGWLGSANMTDQIGLWFAGEYVQLPLRPESVARQFRNVMELEAVGADRAP